MKTAPTFSRPQMAYLKALLTPDCCHQKPTHVVEAGMNALAGRTMTFHVDIGTICTQQKVDAYDRLCRYVGIAPSAKPAEGCEVCATAMKERAKETNRTRMRATRAKKRKERE